MEILLTQGKVAVVDDEDADLVVSWRWFAVEINGIFYAYRNKPSPERGLIAMHRVIAGAPDDPAVLVDHRDRDGLNNRRANVRCSTRAQNGQNRAPNRGRRFKGVHWSTTRRAWIAKTTVNGHHLYIGQFDSAEAAARAYDTAARQHFGPFARTNFPSTEEQYVSP